MSCHVLHVYFLKEKEKNVRHFRMMTLYIPLRTAPFEYHYKLESGMLLVGQYSVYMLYI